ncbi:Pr6Pr family membrane protein [Sphingomonas sp.]|uniref:Pr6Pr family membrane protein n=1 Tax=Sphingomonas sp. TaxID=28214 RepID=UPI0025F8F696|nr:Pr6Pr family membrane protein [Sphingomonas sp.]MBV9528587.1 Pr6Pr family membrane protein [Sphingomonas sp.]
MPRAGAAIVAIVCWAGLAIQFAATFANQHDVLATLWILLRFFTIITNLLVALTMTWVAIGGRASPILLGGLTLAIILVGVVYMLLLRGLLHLSGGALLADTLLHKVSPVLMTLWWLLFAPRARLRFNAPIAWAAYPVAYFIYALLRAHYEHIYPYPFMDVGKLGWLQTALNVGGIALGFIIAGVALVWIDSWRPLGSRGARR